MPYRMQDDSVTVRGKGHPELAGKTVTKQGNEKLIKDGIEPGRHAVGKRGHPEREGGKSTARDVTSVRPKSHVGRPASSRGIMGARPDAWYRR